MQESIANSLEDLVWDKYNEISQSDPDKNIEREINGIPHVDENIDYDDLGDPNQKTQYVAKIAGLKVDIEHWKELEQREQVPTKKQLYKTAKELCIAKKSYMEVKAGFRPESEEVLTIIQEEAQRNDLNRFERFRKWAKENIAGVSAVAISIAGIITTIVIAGRSAVKKGAKAVGEFGKALANVAKKAAPAIATILNILAQVLTVAKPAFSTWSCSICYRIRRRAPKAHAEHRRRTPSTKGARRAPKALAVLGGSGGMPPPPEKFGNWNPGNAIFCDLGIDIFGKNRD